MLIPFPCANLINIFEHFFFGCLSLFSFLFLVSRSIIILFIFYSNHCEKGKSGPLTIVLGRIPGV